MKKYNFFLISILILIISASNHQIDSFKAESTAISVQERVIIVTRVFDFVQ